MTSPVTTRRSFLLQAAVFTGAVAGCASTGSTKSVEATERRAFIEKAMSDLRQQAAAQEEELRRRGSGAALQVATMTPFGDWDCCCCRYGF